LIASDPFLLLNGDSFCKINLSAFLKFHVTKKAPASLALTLMKNPADYGVVTLDGSQRVVCFNEKASVSGTGWVNAGIYLFAKKKLEEIPSGKKQSLEVDLLPSILDQGVYGFVTRRKLLDIGTPDRLERARRYFTSRLHKR